MLVDGDDLIDRSQQIEGTSLRILSPEDNLLQVCLHTAKHSYVRSPGFRLHLDVDQLFRVFYGKIPHLYLVDLSVLSQYFHF